MNIYFTAPIKKGRVHQPEIKTIVATLEQYGSVHAPHTAGTSFSYYGEAGIPDKEIAERELAALAKCDVVVAEVTTPSIGVGYLIARAVAAGKRVVALYGGDNTLELTSMIKGDPSVELFVYKTDADIAASLKTALDSAT